MPEVSASDLVKLRNGKHKSNVYLVIQQPVYRAGNAFSGYEWCAQVDGAPTGDPVASLTVDNASGAASLLDGMTVFIGSEPGAWDKAIVRLRGDQSVTSGTTSVNIASSSDLRGIVEDNDWVTVVDEFRFWQRYQRISESGGSLTWYKDYDILWSDIGSDDATRRLAMLPPVPIMGPHRVRFIDSGGNANVDWDWSDSYAVANGAVVTTWNSWGEDGGAGWTDNVQNPAPKTYTNISGLAGFRTVLEVDDGNGNSVTLPFRRGVRYVFTLRRPGQTQIGDPPNAEPITDFELKNMSGTFSQGYWTADIVVHGSAAHEYEILPGALVIVFSEDWYDTERVSIGPVADCENVLFVGRIVGSSIYEDSETGNVSFKVASDAYLASVSENYSVSCEYDNDASEWYQVPYLTVDRAMHYYMTWHTTLPLISDVYGIPNTEYVFAADIERSSVYAAIDGFLNERLVGRLLCDRYDRFKMDIDLQVRTAGSGTVVMYLTDQDWIESLNISETILSQCNVVDAGGVHFDGSDITAYLSRAPGLSYKYRGKQSSYNGLAVSDQDELNTLSGRLLAYVNNPYPRMEITLANYRIVDIWPQEYVIVSEDTVRHNFSTNRFIPRDISISYEASTGTIFVKWVLEAETDGPPGVTVTIPEEPPVEDSSAPPPPPVTLAGYVGDVAYVLTDHELFRVTNMLQGPAYWEDISPDLDTTHDVLKDFTLDPYDSNTAYVCAVTTYVDNVVMYKTVNLNARNPTWVALMTRQELNDAIGTGSAGGFYAIEASYLDSGFLAGVIVVATAPYSAIWVGHTHDSGSSWHFALAGGSATIIGPMDGLEMSYHDSNRIWVAGRSPINSNPVILRSDDGGHTFPTELGNGVFTSYIPSTIYVPYPDNSSDQIILAGDYYGVYKSTDGGSSWSSLDGNPGLPGGTDAYYCSLECAILDSNKYHMFCYDTSMLYISNDAGANWVSYTTPPRPTNIRPGGWWMYDSKRFYFTRYSSATSPSDIVLAVTFDGGATWHSRTGNYFNLKSIWRSGAKRLIVR